MYCLILELPLGITLIHRQTFEREEKALEKASTLPRGFVVKEKGNGDFSTAIIVPIKEKPVRPEEVIQYLEEGKKPLQAGDTVYDLKLSMRGKVQEVHNQFAEVSYGGAPSVEVPLSRLLRVKP